MTAVRKWRSAAQWTRCISAPVIARIMAYVRAQNRRELLFRVSVGLKALDGAAEILGGAALLLVNPAFIARLVGFLTQDEIAEDPRDLVATYLRHAAAHLSLAGERFISIYLIVHGVLKFGLAAALLKRKLPVFPASIVVFAAFIVYQMYRFTFTHGLGLIVLSGFDLVVIWLIFLEYRALMRQRGNV